MANYKRRRADAIIPYRERLLTLVKIMWDETDGTNPITLTDINEYLEFIYGKTTKRDTLLADIRAIDRKFFRVEAVYLPDYGGYGYYRPTEGEKHADR